MGANRSKDLGSRPLPARDRTMHCSIVTSGISRFAGEKQGIVQRFGQGRFGSIAPGGSIAICTSRKWIGLPIVPVSLLEEIFEFFDTQAEHTVESLQGLVNDEGFALAR